MRIQLLVLVISSL